MQEQEHRYPEFFSVEPLDLYTQFLDTSYGKTLLGNTRFSGFKQGIKNEIWENELGADVNNARHMKLMYGLTRWFIAVHNSQVKEEERFTPHEQELLCVAAAIHDQAEAVKGDIPAPQKTKQNHEEEMEALQRILIDIYGKDKRVLSLCQEAVSEVIVDSTTKLGKAFHAIEFMGYVHTAILAWKKQGIESSLIREQGCTLAKKVKKFSLPKLEAQAHYPAIRHFLDLNKVVLDEIPKL